MARRVICATRNPDRLDFVFEPPPDYVDNPDPPIPHFRVGVDLRGFAEELRQLLELQEEP